MHARNRLKTMWTENVLLFKLKNIDLWIMLKTD